MPSHSLVLIVFVLLALVCAESGRAQPEWTQQELEHVAIRLPVVRPAGRSASERALPSSCTSTVTRLWSPQAISDEIDTAPSPLTAANPSFTLCYSLKTPPPTFTVALSLLYAAIDQDDRPVARIRLQFNSEVLVDEEVELEEDLLLLGPGALLPLPTDFLNLDATGLVTTELLYSVEVDGLWDNQTVAANVYTRWDNADWPTVDGENVTYAETADLALPWVSSAYYAPLPLRAPDVRSLVFDIRTDAELPFEVQVTACLVTELDGCVNDATQCQLGDLVPIVFPDSLSRFQGRYDIDYSSVSSQNASRTKRSNCAATHAMIYVVPRITDSFLGFGPVAFVSSYDVRLHSDNDSDSTSQIITAVVVSVCVVFAILVLGLTIHFFMGKARDSELPSDPPENFPASADEEGDRCALVRR